MAVIHQVGLLGGSFDPVHRAHIALAQAAYQALQLDRVELIPAGHPWQREPLGASAHHRMEMLKIACASDARLVINPIEIDRTGPTYTADTLAALPKTARYTWILGADQLENFCTWHRWRDVLQYARLAVAQRPGASITPPRALLQAVPDGELIRIPFTPQAIAATTIRRLLAEGGSVDAMLDAGVLAYIRKHHLYLDSD